jgi:hypothetical protein
MQPKIVEGHQHRIVVKVYTWIEQKEQKNWHNLICIDDDDSSRDTPDELPVGGRLRDFSSSPLNSPQDEDDDNTNSRHGNIRAQRLIQSIKRIKKANGGALFWEGWMIYTTDKDVITEKRYYWRVDASYVNIFLFLNIIFSI